MLLIVIRNWAKAKLNLMSMNQAMIKKLDIILPLFRAGLDELKLSAKL